MGPGGKKNCRVGDRARVAAGKDTQRSANLPTAFASRLIRGVIYARGGAHW